MTITIRRLTLEDLTSAGTIATAAYGRGSRRSELARYLALRPDGWLLALLDGTPAGIVGATEFGPFAYVGLMAVHPDVQRRGVARRLMEHLIALLDERGCPALLLDASAAGEPLYHSLGFVVDDRAVFYERAEDAPRLPVPLDRHAVSRLRRKDLPAVVAFDTPRFGAARGDVLASYLADDPDRAFVSRDAAGRVTGFLLAQPQALGPWMAETPEDAEALLARALVLPFDEAPIVIAPESHEHAARLLSRYGFAPQRSLAHMRRGGDPLPARRAHLYGQASFAIG